MADGDQETARAAWPATIRPLIAADLPRLHRWYQTPELSEHLVDDIPMRTEDEAVAFMRGWLLPDLANLRFAVVKSDDGALLGRAALLRIADASAELHLFLGDPQARGRGYGQAAMSALLAKAFDELRLDTVRLEVLASNAPALALYQRGGFEQTGVRPLPAVKQGRPVDVLQMALHRDRRVTSDRP